MGQHPGRTLHRPRPLALSRRRNAGKAALGRGNAGLLGAARPARRSRYVMYFSGEPEPPMTGMDFASALRHPQIRPLDRSSISAIRSYADKVSSTSIRWRSRIPQRASTCSTGGPGSTDQGPGARPGPDVVRSSKRAKGPVWPNRVQGCIPGPRRGIWVIRHALFIISSIRATIAAVPRPIMR